MSKRSHLAFLAFLIALLAAVTWQYLPQDTPSVDLTYEIDLENVSLGSLVITLIVEGPLPRNLLLEFPPGVFGDQSNGVTVRSPSAHELDRTGHTMRPLAINTIDGGWRVTCSRAQRVGFIYWVDLNRIEQQELDIRKYISTPIAGGLRAAGFEVFLGPTNVHAENITVAIHNPGNRPLLVPWPALMNRETPVVVQAETDPVPDRSHQEAHLGHGQGYQPLVAALDPDGRPRHQPPATVRSPHIPPVTANLLYHPRDMADLNNSLLICGDIRTATTQARDCVIRFATDRNWLFSDADVLDLVRRIARTEIGFFGSAPTAQITVLLAANEVQGPGRFDTYGIHTGSSVLVFLDPETNWGLLEEQAASVIAHEMFHGWLGEAILQTDPQTLWFTEGATTWYSARMLTAAGIWEPDHSRWILLRRLQDDYAASPLLGKISVAEAAAEVMASAQQVRFAYAGGVAACLALDQHLTLATGLQRPLDQVLRHLYENRAEGPLSRESLAAAVQTVTGIDCRNWLDRHVYGKTALPPPDRLI